MTYLAKISGIKQNKTGQNVNETNKDKNSIPGGNDTKNKYSVEEDEIITDNETSGFEFYEEFEGDEDRKYRRNRGIEEDKEEDSELADELKEKNEESRMSNEEEMFMKGNRGNVENEKDIKRKKTGKKGIRRNESNQKRTEK